MNRIPYNAHKLCSIINLYIPVGLREGGGGGCGLRGRRKRGGGGDARFDRVRIFFRYLKSFTRCSQLHLSWYFSKLRNKAKICSLDFQKLAQVVASRMQMISLLLPPSLNRFIVRPLLSLLTLVRSLREGESRKKSESSCTIILTVMNCIICGFNLFHNLHVIWIIWRQTNAYCFQKHSLIFDR